MLDAEILELIEQVFFTDLSADEQKWIHKKIDDPVFPADSLTGIKEQVSKALMMALMLHRSDLSLAELEQIRSALNIEASAYEELANITGRLDIFKLSFKLEDAYAAYLTAKRYAHIDIMEYIENQHYGFWDIINIALKFFFQFEIETEYSLFINNMREINDFDDYIHLKFIKYLKEILSEQEFDDLSHSAVCIAASSGNIDVLAYYHNFIEEHQELLPELFLRAFQHHKSECVDFIMSTFKINMQEVFQQFRDEYQDLSDFERLALNAFRNACFHGDMTVFDLFYYKRVHEQNHVPDALLDHCIEIFFAQLSHLASQKCAYGTLNIAVLSRIDELDREKMKQFLSTKHANGPVNAHVYFCQALTVQDIPTMQFIEKVYGPQIEEIDKIILKLQLKLIARPHPKIYEYLKTFESFKPVVDSVEDQYNTRQRYFQCDPAEINGANHASIKP